ncbi:MAG: hypothetical protein DHS20C21_07370 [Gemmatimonadota bacterium]|nr:MAG: hypothetical protein DHS20C21_07370 [Gemmatimonadota bacterium]
MKRAPDGRVRAALFWTLLGAGVALLRTHDIGLIGHDTYPVLVASRIESWADLWGAFTEPLMDGRFRGTFFRPLLSLSIALDDRIWGLNPVGYQLTNAVLFGAATAAVHSVSRSLSGPGTPASWIAPLLFAGHPGAIAVVAFASRRSESMVCLFLLLIVIEASRRGATGSRTSWFPAFLWTVLAIGSREVAYVAPFLATGVALAVEVANERRVRLRVLLDRTWPIWTAAALMMGLRFAVLGTLGGHHEFEPGRMIDRMVPAVAETAVRVAAIEGFRASAWVTVLLAGVMIALLLRKSRREPTSEESGSDGRRPFVLPAVGLLWLGGLGAVYSAAPAIAEWYVLAAVVGWSLIVGGLASVGERAWRSIHRRTRSMGLLAMAATSIVVAAQLQSGLWFHDPARWRAATADTSQFLAALGQQVEAARGGSVLATEPLPQWEQERGSTAKRAFALSGYSVQGWLDLMYPDRKARVILRVNPAPAGLTAIPQPPPDELIVLVPVWEPSS